MKGWWVRYKFCNLARRWRILDGRRARPAGGDLGFLGTSAVANRPNYPRRLLKGLSRPRPAGLEIPQIGRAKPQIVRLRGRNPVPAETETREDITDLSFKPVRSLIARRSV